MIAKAGIFASIANGAELSSDAIKHATLARLVGLRIQVVRILRDDLMRSHWL
jgi:hypothetical protein